MQRVFIEDVGRFKKGDIRDYPKGTWGNIARSSNNKLESITTSVESAVMHNGKRGGKR